MFDDYQGIIDIKTILLENYNYNFTGDFKDLYKQPFIEVEGNGMYAMFWILYKDEKYLFKPIKDPEINIWGELLSEKLAKYMGLPCAEYRACKFHDLKGVITKSIIKDNEILIPGSEIFQYFLMRYQYSENFNIIKDPKFKEIYQIPDEYEDLDPLELKRYLFNYLNNLDHIWSILSLNDKIAAKDIVKIMIHLKRLVIFDIISLQTDRHHSNWGIIYDGLLFKPAPLFDNSSSFGLGYFSMDRRIQDFNKEILNTRHSNNYDYLHKMLYEKSPILSVQPENTINFSKREKDKAPKVLEDYLSITDEKTNYIISNLIAHLNTDKLLEMIKEIENENGITMTPYVYDYITNTFYEHIKVLKDTLKNYWRTRLNVRKK